MAPNPNPDPNPNPIPNTSPNPSPSPSPSPNPSPNPNRNASPDQAWLLLSCYLTLPADDLRADLLWSARIAVEKVKTDPRSLPPYTSLYLPISPYISRS